MELGHHSIQDARGRCKLEDRDLEEGHELGIALALTHLFTRFHDEEVDRYPYEDGISRYSGTPQGNVLCYASRSGYRR